MRQAGDERELIGSNQSTARFQHDDLVGRIGGHFIEGGQIDLEWGRLPFRAKVVITQEVEDRRDVCTPCLTEDHACAAATKAVIAAPSLTPGALSTPELTST